MTTQIITPGDAQATDRGTVGGKAAALARLVQDGFDVPPYFVVPAAALDTCPTEIADPLAAEICRGLDQFCPGGRVAIRSSAIEEDAMDHSFAGLFDTLLCVDRVDVLPRILAVRRSGTSDRLVHYRRAAGSRNESASVAVIVQRMVAADVSGVAFAADPVTGRRGVAVVAARRGLGDALVAGKVNGDTFHVDRDGRIIDSQLTAEGTPVIGTDQVAKIAALARRVSRRFGSPQDLEWAIEDGRLYVLQSRPITTLSRLADPDGLAVLWDNANIVESYSGVTTPLTFSFARTAYEGVYRQFARLMSVPQRTIDENANTFRHMLGLLHGRVYYNLLNWYRVLAMLPGFQSNRRFMEQMMGVREPLPEPLAATLAAEYEAPSWFGRMTDRLQLALAAVRLAGRQLTLPKRIREFQGRVDAALAPGQRPLEDLRLDELVAEYRQLESRLVTRWDAPLVNDFFTMIYFGLVRSLARQWCGDDQDGLCRELVSGHRELVSAEPAKWIERMARLAADGSAPSPAGRGPLLAALCEGSAEEALARIAEIPELEREFQSYLEHSGDRCLEELKLESPTLADDPLPLVRAIGRLAMRLGDGDAFNADRSQNSDAQQRVARSLRGHPLRRLVFRRIVRRARRHVRDREALRFERTRVFGRVRRIVVEIGRRLVAEGSLDDARDVFYLELHEVLGFAEGTISCPDFRALTSVRKAEFARYREAAPPAGRCETRGAVHVGNDFLGGPSPRSRDTRGSDGTLLEGIGCCRGVVRGRVRVVRDPRSVTIATGEILVAEQTDPGWVMLFPAAAGVLVERGSLLSHSAVLARELGIPTIVAIADLTSRLSDGDYVEVDGTSGTVRILRRAAVASSRSDAADEVRRYRTASSAV